MSSNYNGEKCADIQFLNSPSEKFTSCRLSSTIPMCKMYKYFEVEVLFNKSNSEIVIGYCETKHFRSDGLPENAESTFYVSGKSGKAFVNGKEVGNFNFSLTSFGESGGLLQFIDKKADLENI